MTASTSTRPCASDSFFRRTDDAPDPPFRDAFRPAASRVQGGPRDSPAHRAGGGDPHGESGRKDRPDHSAEPARALRRHRRVPVRRVSHPIGDACPAGSYGAGLLREPRRHPAQPPGHPAAPQGNIREENLFPLPAGAPRPAPSRVPDGGPAAVRRREGGGAPPLAPPVPRSAAVERGKSAPFASAKSWGRGMFDGHT